MQGPREAMSLGPDSNIFSQRRIESWIPGGQQGTEFAESPFVLEDDIIEATTNSLLKRFDSTVGRVRHAADLESHLRGLYITRDNLDTMLQSFDIAGQREDFAASILTALRRGAYVFENDNILK